MANAELQSRSAPTQRLGRRLSNTAMATFIGGLDRAYNYAAGGGQYRRAVVVGAISTKFPADLPVKTRTELEAAVDWLHTDPEQLPGTPSNGQIIAGNADLTRFGVESLSAGERQGFLEMWRFGEARNHLEGLNSGALAEVYQSASTELTELEAAQQRITDLRFITSVAQQALATRQAIKGE